MTCQSVQTPITARRTLPVVPWNLGRFGAVLFWEAAAARGDMGDKVFGRARD
jgi:hypothetical protein